MTPPADPPADPPAGRDDDRLILAEVVRAALERAVAVARDRAADPAGPEAPAVLRPVVRFRRLTGPAATAALVALDDDGFRAAVADGATEAALGRPAWLYLTRPDGWEDEVGAAVADATARRAAGDADRHAAELTRLREQVEEERSRREALQREVDRLQRRVAAAAAERDDLAADRAAAETASERARQERQVAVRDLKAVEARLAARTAELRELRDRGAAVGDGGDGDVGGDDGATDPGPGVDLVELWDRADELAERARALGDAVTALRQALPEPSPPTGATGAVAAGAGGVDRPVRRRPLRPGRGLVEGTLEATEVLLGVAGIEVLIDGYNVTLRTWPELEIAEQRRRLEHGAAALAARTGASITLVYDGTGEGGRPARSAPSAVKVRFTPEDREADDEILDLLDALAPERPALVVSDDRRVVDGAAARGANTVSGAVLVALFRR